MKNGQLRVWWIPQVGVKGLDPFYVNVTSIAVAKTVFDALADYDIYQLENDIKHDFCNMGGLHIFQDGEWHDWESIDGEDFSDYLITVCEEQASRL